MIYERRTGSHDRAAHPQVSRVVARPTPAQALIFPTFSAAGARSPSAASGSSSLEAAGATRSAWGRHIRSRRPARERRRRWSAEPPAPSRLDEISPSTRETPTLAVPMKRELLVHISSRGLHGGGRHLPSQRRHGQEIPIKARGCASADKGIPAQAMRHHPMRVTASPPARAPDRHHRIDRRADAGCHCPFYDLDCSGANRLWGFSARRRSTPRRPFERLSSSATRVPTAGILQDVARTLRAWSAPSPATAAPRARHRRAPARHRFIDDSRSPTTAIPPSVTRPPTRRSRRRAENLRPDLPPPAWHEDHIWASPHRTAIRNDAIVDRLHVGQRGAGWGLED